MGFRRAQTDENRPVARALVARLARAGDKPPRYVDHGVVFVGAFHA